LFFNQQEAFCEYRLLYYVLIECGKVLTMKINLFFVLKTVMILVIFFFSACSDETVTPNSNEENISKLRGDQ